MLAILCSILALLSILFLCLWRHSVYAQEQERKQHSMREAQIESSFEKQLKERQIDIPVDALLQENQINRLKKTLSDTRKKLRNTTDKLEGTERAFQDAKETLQETIEELEEAKKSSTAKLEAVKAEVAGQCLNLWSENVAERVQRQLFPRPAGEWWQVFRPVFILHSNPGNGNANLRWTRRIMPRRNHHI